ncbi:L-gulonolactone oxidase 3 isoform X2 [Amborella trichopoda]|uniref:L-gulonolactone oxidase 3 isoform X2 n=1 Tax=Amborella trichopoda TaxID=13333 RepID=UPI0009BDC14C|nr:L-gulonolactone oxidase 3 isoform X2 [Amborella trichopoda]|eukprot:XP_020518302.1 L-gulonolactone oxidase 3 isoform X2 [Amborella trichopoda]
MAFLNSLLTLTIFLSATTTFAKPPAPPLTCDTIGCNLTNGYGTWGDRRPCKALKAFYPTTEEELRSTIAEAVRQKLKVKVVSGFSHTIPKLACPDLPENSVIISTRKYNSGIEVDIGKSTVTVDSGVGLRTLIDKLEEEGLSLVASPYWEGASLGGIISTGAHGSSWWGKGGGVHDYVVELRMVVPASASEGYAKVKLSLEPVFKRSVTNLYKDDTLLEEEFMDHAKKHEFADITWYPSQKKVVYKSDDRVPLNTCGNGVNDFLGFRPNGALVSAAVRSTEKALESTKNVKGKCLMAATELAYKQVIANGLKNNDLIFTGYPVVGMQGKMQASGSCLNSPETSTDTCPWDPRIKGLFFYETTAIFPAPNFRDFIIDVKKLRDLKPENFCGVDIYNGFLIRFIKASDAYLGQSEDSVVVDFNYYRADSPLTPRLNQDVWEEVEQMAFFKYSAKPHWAKNRKLAFAGVQQKYPKFKDFVAAKKRIDPDGVFSSKWSDEILFGTETPKSDGCALEGLCICSEDRHCSPQNDYFCRQGLVYKAARVCRYSPSSEA